MARRFAVVTLLLFALVACRQDTPAVPAQEIAVTTDASAASEFSILSITGEADEGRPALTIRFSEPLAQAQDLNQYIKVTGSDGKTVDGSWVMQDESRLITFPNVKAQEKFKIEIAPGIVSAGGDSLASGQISEVSSVDLPPAALFASQGSVLPAQGTDGLPILTINVPEVDIEFYRVRSQSVPRFLREFQSGGRRGYWDLNVLKRIADSVYLNRFVTGGGANERRTTHVPVHQIDELTPPGLYFVLMKPAGQVSTDFQTNYFVRSDIGVHVRRHAHKTWVAARSLASGKALGGVDLTLIDGNGVTLQSLATDSDGLAVLDAPFATANVLLAARGDELSLLPFHQPALDLSDFDIAGRTGGETSLFIWSGRDLYRPGEPLRISALLRDSDGRTAGNPPLFGFLKQPDGRVYASAQLKANNAGYYLYERAMPPDVATGRWRLELSTDPSGHGAVHSYLFRIEEFLPERMKLNVDSVQKTLATGQALELNVEGAYLYGAPASGNRFTAKVMYAVDHAPVGELKGYHFGDPVNPPDKEPVDVIDAPLDDSGSLRQEIAIEPGQVAGPVAVTVIGSLFETGGRPVSRILKRTLWPAGALVGVRPLFEGDLSGEGAARFEVLKVKADGTRVAARGLVARLIREDRDYTWNYDENLGWKVDFTQSFVEVESQTLEIPGDNPGSLVFNASWGPHRIEITDPETGLTTRFAFNVGWSFDDDNRGVDARPEKVKVALDKTTYKVGDTLTATITPPHSGPGLLLVETDRVLRSIEFDARPGVAVDVTLDSDWQRHDLYVTALVFRPGTSKDKITPSRAVGIAHVPWDRSDRNVELALNAPAAIRPNQPLKVSVNAPGLADQVAQVTVSAVDQGILNITQFEVPDPIKEFFGKRRYAIDAYDVYGRIIEALAGERARLKFGGDLAVPGLPQARRPTAKVLTVDLFSGAVSLDAAGHAEVTLNVPDFNGALRVSAVAFSADRFGSASVETLVRAPLLAEVSTPRVMAPDDTARLTLDLHNLSGKPLDLTLGFAASGPIAIDDAARRLRMAVDQRTTLSFALRALSDVGIGKFALSARGGDVELNRQFEIAVRSTHAPERVARLEQLTGATEVDLSQSVDGLAPSSLRSRVSASTRAPLAVNQLIADLAEYPYGCIEQTTSKGYPYVLVGEASAGKLGVAFDTEKREANVAYAIDRISSMQLDNGHFGFWPGSDYSDPQITPYVVEFLQDAQSAGYAVPARLLQRSLERLREDLLAGGTQSWERGWGEVGEHIKLAFNAHAGYVLARVNQAPLGTLRNVFDSSTDGARGPLPLMRLAAALKLAGDLPRAQQAAQKALNDRYARGPEYYGDYFSAVGDRAAALAVAIEHDLLPQSETGRVIEVSREARGSLFLNTHDKLALIKLAKALAANPAPLAGELVVGSQREGFKVDGWFTRDLVIEDLRAGASLNVSSTGTFFLAQDTVGIPLAAPAPVSNGVRITTRWFRHGGAAFVGDSLTEGEGLVVHLRIDAEEQLSDLLVTDALAGGLEIENLNLMDSKQLAELTIDGTNLDEWRSYGSNLRYQEYREDRYVAALSLSAGSSTDLYYLVRAVSPGTYSVPASVAEDMYRPQNRAIGTPVVRRIVVVEPQ